MLRRWRQACVPREVAFPEAAPALLQRGNGPGAIHMRDRHVDRPSVPTGAEVPGRRVRESVPRRWPEGPRPAPSGSVDGELFSRHQRRRLPPLRLAFFSRLSYWWLIRCACSWEMKSITTTTTISRLVPPK